MASERFLKAQGAIQTQFGTPAAAAFAWPGQAEYEDGHEEREVEIPGTWAPRTLVAKVAEYATVKLSGVAYFELLPVLFNAGFAAMTPTGEDPYVYAGEVDPDAVGAPIPYTWLVGGGGDLGATGPAVKIQDAYVESLTLSGNLNNRAVEAEVNWFGLKVDDNSGAGYDFGAVDVPTNLEMLKVLMGALSVKDAATTGGSFATMTAIQGKMLDWQLTINTGLKPIWSSDNGALTFNGVRHEAPSVEFSPTLRTDSATYAAVKAKQAAKTYQELKLALTGAATRAATFQVTGRWTECGTVHAREGGEIVMKPKFIAQTPHTQTTTPHWFDWAFTTKWTHGGA